MPLLEPLLLVEPVLLLEPALLLELLLPVGTLLLPELPPHPHRIRQAVSALSHSRLKDDMHNIRSAARRAVEDSKIMDPPLMCRLLARRPTSLVVVAYTIAQQPAVRNGSEPAGV